MKRIILLFLLFLFLFNVAGYYFVFLLLDSENRSEMQSSLPGSALQTIRIPKSQLKNVIINDGGKEVCINGETFDVQSVRMEGDYLVIKGIDDIRETRLTGDLAAFVKNNYGSSSEKKQNDSSKNPVKDLFFHCAGPEIVSSLPVSYKPYFGTGFRTAFPVTSPPPRTA